MGFLQEGQWMNGNANHRIALLFNGGSSLNPRLLRCNMHQSIGFPPVPGKQFLLRRNNIGASS